MSSLRQAYLLWRDRSLPRWQSLLGDDAGDLLQETYLRLERAEGFVYTSESATMRYIETVASYVLRDMRRTKARRQELVGVALELGARGLVQNECAPLAPRLELEQVIASAGLSPRQRLVIVGVRRGVDRATLAEMLEVSMETVREHERAAVARLRDAAKGVGK